MTPFLRCVKALVLWSSLMVLRGEALTPLETTAKQAVIVDATTGAVLFDKNAHERMNPSSMTKVLTTYLIFERLRDKRLALTDEFTVSPHAQSMEGTRMFVEAGTRVRLEDLLRGIIVQSGNDACVVVAEAIAGSEALFAQEMTKKAHSFGANKTHFTNASGLPSPEHQTTAYDLALIAQRVISDFPEYYHYFSEKEFTYNHIKQTNRNALLSRSLGVDGLKTGSSNIAGLGMIASALRQGRRLIVVANGFKTDTERSLEIEKMIDWAFREFETVTIAKAGTPVTNIEVWSGDISSVAVTSPVDIVLTVAKSGAQLPQATVHYASPIVAPVAKGTQIATLKVSTSPTSAPIDYPLLALDAVKPAPFLKKVAMTLDYLLWGKRQPPPIDVKPAAAP